MKKQKIKEEKHTLKLKDIEKMLGKYSCYRSDNNQNLIVKCCRVGDNYYGYGKKAPKTLDWSYCPELKNDHRIHIALCEDCCCCGDW